MFKNKIPGEENSYRFIYFLGFNILKNKKKCTRKIVLYLYFENKVWKSSKKLFLFTMIVIY